MHAAVESRTDEHCQIDLVSFSYSMKWKYWIDLLLQFDVSE